MSAARFHSFDDEESEYWGRFCGGGHFSVGEHVEGGIYMASTVANTCKVWNALVTDKNIVDRHGSCEHLRHLFGEGVALKANELVWMTDRTPHEAVPRTQYGYRQFFRLVTSQISHWYAAYSTPNPNVPVPDHVVIVEGNKFVQDWHVLRSDFLAAD